MTDKTRLISGLDPRTVFEQINQIYEYTDLNDLTEIVCQIIAIKNQEIMQSRREINQLQIACSYRNP